MFWSGIATSSTWRSRNGEIDADPPPRTRSARRRAESRARYGPEEPDDPAEVRLAHRRVGGPHGQLVRRRGVEASSWHALTVAAATAGLARRDPVAGRPGARTRRSRPDGDAPRRSTASSSTAGSPRRRGARTAPTSAPSPTWLERARSRTRRGRRTRPLRLGVRPRQRARPALAPRRSRAGSRRCARACASRSAPPRSRTLRSHRAGRGACPTPRRRPRSSSCSRQVDGDSPLALRNRALLELLYSAGLRSAEATALDLADVDFDREVLHVRRQGRKGAGRPARRGGRARARPLPARRAPRARDAARTTPSSSPHAADGSTRARFDACFGTRTGSGTRSPRTSSRAAPTCA